MLERLRCCGWITVEDVNNKQMKRILLKAYRHDKRICMWALIRSVCMVLMPFVAAYVLRYVLNEFQQGVQVQTVAVGVVLLLIAEGSLRYGSVAADRHLEVLLNDFRQSEIADMLAVVNSTEYEHLESDEFWRSNQHAVQATRRNFAGNEGLLHDFLNIIIAVFSCITSVCILIFTNVYLLIVLLVLLVLYVWLRIKIVHRIECDSSKYNSDMQKIELHKSQMLDPEYAPGYLRTNAYFISMSKLIDLMKAYVDGIAKDNGKLFLFGMLASVLVLAQNGILYGAIGTSISDVSAMLFQIYACGILLQNIENLASILCQSESDSVQVEKYYDFLLRYGRKADNTTLAVNGDKITLSQGIELQNVLFRYGKDLKDSLKNINLSIGVRERIAILGPNGAGKSTLIHLLIGLLQEKQGQVLIDGKVREPEEIDKYFGLFSACFQQPCIFPMNIIENVALCSASEVDMERYREVIRLVGLEKAISQLPEQDYTILSSNLVEGSTGLSGGERQKLVLARALYKQSPVLILDEPTAALDPIAEVEMFEKLTSFAKDKALIYITHRLSCARYCDQIVYMNEGRITEMGTHDELMQNRGMYEQQYRAQMAYYE